MSDYTITITSAEEKALKTVMVNIKEWITNFKEVRAAQATKEITTKLLVDNGDIVVIGGIKIHNTSNTRTKTPGLGDVPIVGNLFKGKTAKNKLEEMLIFLSPRVLD